MIGPLPPAVLQVASSASEPAQSVLPVRPADDPRAGTGVELSRAARPIPDDTGQRGIEGAIAATESTIRMTEEVARRDRDRLERYPVEMEELRATLGTTKDASVMAETKQKLAQLHTAFGAARARLSEHDATWPEQRATLQRQIDGYRTELARTAYGQL